MCNAILYCEDRIKEFLCKIGLWPAPEAGLLIEQRLDPGMGQTRHKSQWIWRKPLQVLFKS